MICGPGSVTWGTVSGTSVGVFSGVVSGTVSWVGSVVAGGTVSGTVVGKDAAPLVGAVEVGAGNSVCMAY